MCLCPSAMSHRVFQVLQAVPGGLGWQQEPPSPPGLRPETGSTAGESEEGAAGHRDVAASEEGSEQLSSASGGRAAPPRLEHVPGTAVGCVLSRYGSGMCPCLPLPRLLFLPAPLVGVWWLSVLFSLLFLSFLGPCFLPDCSGQGRLCWGLILGRGTVREDFLTALPRQALV